MKRLIIQLRKFSEILDLLIKQHKVTKADFEEFEKVLIGDPEVGAFIQGSGGLRKTRLKSTSHGKSGGFRVCYCDIKEKKLFLILIYAKNVKEDLSTEELKVLKVLVDTLRKESVL